MPYVDREGTPEHTTHKDKQPFSEYPFEETVISFDKGEVSKDELMAEYRERLAACVREAPADPLAMLEALAKAGANDPSKAGCYPLWKGLQVTYCPATDTFTYLPGCWFGDRRDSTRAEAAALLADVGEGVMHWWKFVICLFKKHIYQWVKASSTWEDYKCLRCGSVLYSYWDIPLGEDRGSHADTR